MVKKQDCLIELFSLKLLEANYMADPQLEAIRDMLVKKEPNFAEAARAMGGYLVPLDGRAAGHSHSVTPTHHQSNPQLPPREDQYDQRGRGYVVPV